MLGKASEIRSELIDARELDSWLRNSLPDTYVVSVQFSMVDNRFNGVMPQALIIYKVEPDVF